MTNADFYIGLGEDAKWIGSLSVDGSTADMDDAGLFGPPPDDMELYTETTFLNVVLDVLGLADDADRGYLAANLDPWPWPWKDSVGTDMAYAFAKGCIHVFERGYLVALHYPNGARNPSRFPQLGE